MDFQRIDKNTVQCRMTEEEMNEYGLEIEDFFTNQEKSREFLEQIVERAEEEIGYEVESGMVSMQLMRMPDNSLTITFSERGEEGIQNMLHQIQNLAGMIDDGDAEEIIENLQKEDDEAEDTVEDEVHTSENMDTFQKENVPKDSEMTSEYKKHMKEAAKKKQEKEKKMMGASKVYEFRSLRDLEDFAATLDSGKDISSKVYKDQRKGKFYLLVKKGKLKMTEYLQLCRQLSEYAKFCSQQPYVEQYCREHFDCLIFKHALKILKEYQN